MFLKYHSLYFLYIVCWKIHESHAFRIVISRFKRTNLNIEDKELTRYFVKVVKYILHVQCMYLKLNVGPTPSLYCIVLLLIIEFVYLLTLNQFILFIS